MREQAVAAGRHNEEAAEGRVAAGEGLQQASQPASQSEESAAAAEQTRFWKTGAARQAEQRFETGLHASETHAHQCKRHARGMPLLLLHPPPVPWRAAGAPAPEHSSTRRRGCAG